MSNRPRAKTPTQLIVYFFATILLMGPLTFSSYVIPAEAILINIPEGTIIVATTDGSGLVLIDPVTGEQTLFEASLTSNIQGIAVEADGKILVSDSGAEPAIVRLDPTVPFSDTLVTTPGGLINDPFGLAIEASGDIIVADSSEGIIRVDAVTGAETLLSAPSDILQEPTSVSIGPDGSIYASGSLTNIIKIHPGTGVQTIEEEGGEQFNGPFAPTTDAQVSSGSSMSTTISDTFTDSGGTTPGSFVKRTSASSDDAEQGDTGTGLMSLTSSDLELHFDGSDDYVGMRWTGVTVPSGATITNAEIQFHVDEDANDPNPVTLNFAGQLIADAPEFTTTAHDITDRTNTVADVSWAVPTWVANDDELPAQLTPDLSPIVQEIVNQGGWSSGNAMVIMINTKIAPIGTGARTAESFNGESTAAPELNIDYTTVGGDVDLDSHTPDTGNQWVENTNTGSTKAQVRDATGKIDANEDVNSIGKSYFAKPDPTSADQTLSITLEALDDTSGTKPVGMFGRMTDNSNLYFLQILPNSHARESLTLLKMVGGSPSKVGVFDATLAVGDVIKLEITDATKKVFQNGVERISSTDNELTSAGQWGIYWGNFAMGSGHVRSTWQLDNFVAEEPGSANTSCSNPTNAYVNEPGNNPNYAECEGDSSQSDPHAFQDFGFNLAADVTIDGIEVNLDHAHEQASDTGYWTVRILDASGNPVGDYKVGTDDGHTQYTDEAFGGQFDTWNTGLTVADLNDSDFGVLVNYTQTAGGGGNDGRLDAVEVSVHYNGGILQSSGKGTLDDSGNKYLTGETELIETHLVSEAEKVLASGFTFIEDLAEDANGDYVLIDMESATVTKVDKNSGQKTTISTGGYLTDYMMAIAVMTTDVTVDADGDGIYDVVDPLVNTLSDDSTDIPLGGTTSLTILDRNALEITVRDLPEPQGIYISANTTSQEDHEAKISVCSGAAELYFQSGDSASVKCSSVIVHVLTGNVHIVYSDDKGNKLDSTLNVEEELYFDPDSFSLESRSGSPEVTIVTQKGSSAEVTLEHKDKVSFDIETSTITASESDVDEIAIVIDGVESTLSTGDSTTLDVPELIAEDVPEVIEEDVPEVIEEDVPEPIVEEDVVLLSKIDEDAILTKKLKEEAKDEAIKEVVKKQKAKTKKKSELSTHLNEFKQMKNEIITLKKQGQNTDDLKSQLTAIILNFQNTFDILKAEFGYDAEYKSNLKEEIKQKNQMIYEKMTKSEQAFNRKVSSKLSELSQSDDPASTAKKLGLIYKNGKTIVTVSITGSNENVLDNLESIGRVDAVSDSQIQLTLDLKNLKDLGLVPGVSQITPSFVGVQN